MLLVLPLLCICVVPVGVRVSLCVEGGVGLVGGGCGVLVGLLFEICIVDASIFVAIVLLCL